MDNADDDIGQTLAATRGDATAERAAMDQLSESSLLVLLTRAPGAGDAAPQRNLLTLIRNQDGAEIVPLFTRASRITFPVTQPLVLVSTPMRVIVTTCGYHRYVINALTPEDAFEIDDARWTQLKECIASHGYDPEAPTRDSPWAFRYPPDSMYPIAYALARWFTDHGRVDEAYLYEVTRMRSQLHPRKLIVLGLNEPLDLDLAKTLSAVAIEAGAPTDAFVVRFLPEEPSHQAGIAGVQLQPFWKRPGS